MLHYCLCLCMSVFHALSRSIVTVANLDKSLQKTLTVADLQRITAEMP